MRHLQIGDISGVSARVSITKCHLAICDRRLVHGLKGQRDKTLTNYTLLKEGVCDSRNDLRFVSI